MNTCIFCNIDEKRIISKYEKFVVIRDLFPVTHLHTLIIPKRCIPSYFDLNEKEFIQLQKIIIKEKEELTKLDKSISGFNLGATIGEDSGQTIFHCHIHLIPRRKGDSNNPRGGIRGVIPNKQNY